MTRPSPLQRKRTAASSDASSASSGRPYKADPLIEGISYWMDEAFQVGGFRFGLDPLFSLIPVGGDVASSVVGVVIIGRAVQHGVPWPSVLRMMANLGVDSLLGSISVVGDAADFFWKANRKNLEIYRQSLSGTRNHRRDLGAVVAMVAVALVVALLPLLLLWWVLSAVWPWLKAQV